MSRAIKSSFSLRGLAGEVTEEHLTQFFIALGCQVASIRMVPARAYPPVPAGAYVNLAGGDVEKVLAVNGTKPPFNAGLVLSVRKQDAGISRVVAAVNDIVFSISVRGIHWMTPEDVIAEQMGSALHCKVHSIKVTAPPVQQRFATKAAFINYAAGDKAGVLALDSTAPAWNNAAAITVREQDLGIARKAAAKPITASLAAKQPVVAPLTSRKRKMCLTVTGEDSQDSDDDAAEAAEGAVGGAGQAAEGAAAGSVEGPSSASAGSGAAGDAGAGGVKGQVRAAGGGSKMAGSASKVAARGSAIDMAGGLLSASKRKALEAKVGVWVSGPALCVSLAGPSSRTSPGH